MSKTPIYVRFNVPPELMERTYECIKLAAETGKIKKGVNESTKAVERGLAKFLVIAQDVDPQEIVAHLPLLAEEKKVPYSYVDSKVKLGQYAGIEVAASSVVIIDPGKAKPLMDEIIAKVTEIRKGTTAEVTKPEQEAKEEKPKEEEKPKRKKKSEESQKK
ncbi:MAG: 50S ribosomal protein L7Ae [Candidatus Methanomethylicia archaeon]|nr:50S ribosomal protein L7Ae [Candidatus Methanomethylicia archaeon]